MALLYQPKFKLTINGFDVSSTIEPYLISIELEDSFDYNFTVSRLELIFHAKYRRSSNWQYKDQLKLELWWAPFPIFKLVTGTFYLDYIEDIKNSGGTQTFRVSALEADPTLGFNYGANEIVLTNKTTKQAVTDFATLFGLTLTENLTDDVYMGTISDVFTGTPNLNEVKITFQSYADMLKYICNTFGYFGNLSGKDLELRKVESSSSTFSRFFVYDMKDIYNLNSKQTYNKLNRTYEAISVNRPTSNTQLVNNQVQPNMQAQLNSKTRKLEHTDAYYNVVSAVERASGAIYTDFYSGFEVVLSMSGLPEFEAGKLFLLNSSYGHNEGLYRCIKVRHRVDAGGWNAEITGFPLRILESTTATFDLGYVGSYQNPPASNTINISQVIAGSNTTITAAQLDNYAKSFNPNYNLNLGAIFLSEGNKAGNLIRPDIAFCQALIETYNFTDADLISKNNSGNLGTASGGFDAASFASWTIGIRAHIQHLFAYATTTGTPADPIVDPRFNFVVRGDAPKIDDLVGKWSIDNNYGTTLKSKLLSLYTFINPNFNYVIID